MILHISLQSKGYDIIRCYGITKHPNTGDYMLVLQKLKMDLRSFINQNYSILKWKNVYQIFWRILSRIYYMHEDNIVHKDLHSGNILIDKVWDITDFGLCGPADKPQTKIYGNMPYMAPEVIRGGVYTTAADIYSIGMLMYETAAGHQPFLGIDPDIYLALEICRGIRPTLPEDIPESYASMMKRCWDADLLKRPTTDELFDYFYYQYETLTKDWDSVSSFVCSPTKIRYDTSSIASSKSSLFSFENLPEPRNATNGKNLYFYKLFNEFIF